VVNNLFENMTITKMWDYLMYIVSHFTEKKYFHTCPACGMKFKGWFIPDHPGHRLVCSTGCAYAMA